MQVKPNQSVRILAGKYKGLAGEVVATDDENDTVSVRVFGVVEDVPTDETVDLKSSSVGAM